MSKIKIMIKEPEKTPYFTEIENSLEEMQKAVGGYIETVTIASDLVIICNEEGRVRDFPYNCNICGISFVGTILFCGILNDEFCDVPFSEYDFCFGIFGGRR